MSGKSKTSQVERKHRKEKIDAAIRMVNDVVSVRLAPSDIHGIGVFAIRDIKKGERLYVDAMPEMLDIPYKRFKDIREEVREVILERFPRVATTNSHFLAPDTLMQIYMNHSDNPNYSNKDGKALRKIKKGEEVTENYRDIEGWEKVYKWLKSA